MKKEFLLEYENKWLERVSQYEKNKS